MSRIGLSCLSSLGEFGFKFLFLSNLINISYSQGVEEGCSSNLQKLHVGSAPHRESFQVLYQHKGVDRHC